MKAWLKLHQKKLSMVLGAFMLLAGAAMLFWDNQGQAMVGDGTTASKRVVHPSHTPMVTHETSKPDKPIFSQKFQERQERQLRYAVILLMILGIGFMGYSFYRRYQDKKRS